jgi:hypothetical protein
VSTEILNNREGILTVKVSGHLTQAELLTTQKAAADILREHGGSSVLFVAEDFEGWEKGAEWADMSAQSELDLYARRIAIVGEGRWKDLALLFAGKGVRHVDIEYFFPPELDKARAWLSIK